MAVAVITRATARASASIFSRIVSVVNGFTRRLVDAQPSCLDDVVFRGIRGKP